MANTSSSSSSSTSGTSSDSKDSRWYFTAEQLAHSPSRRQGINAEQELSYRQQTAYLIQEMGQRLSVSQLCINTAIVYMHRFYAFHSFTHFHRNGIAAASLFLAAKVEEQPRKLEHVIKVSHLCLNTESPSASTELYNEQAQDLVFNENVLLQTLGFDVAIDHPHTHVVKTCHLVKACKDLAQTSYFLASNSLHLTSMCLQYRPTVVACFCIYLACKWSRWEIPQSTEGKHWFHYVDTSVTLDLLKQLTDEFLAIYEKSPARLKAKLNSIKALAQSARMNEPSRPLPDANGSSSQVPESARRPDSYSSHHKHHSSSTTSHHNHHSKQTLPPNESGEHCKVPSSHKQPSYPGSHPSSNRPRSDRPQAPVEGQVHPPHGNSKQSMMPSAQRSTGSGTRMPHGMVVPGTSSSHRAPHAPHDPNYHKSRRDTQANPAVGGHKATAILKPNDPQRNLMKDPSGLLAAPNKVPMKPPGNTSSGSNNGSSSNIHPGASVAGTAGLDMTRNVLQGSAAMSQQSSSSQQRNAYNQPNTVQPSNYNQPIPNRNSSNTSAKYDQSVQQQMHLQPGQKQSLESSFSTTNSRQMDDSNIKTEKMEICSPTKLGNYQQSSNQPVQTAPNKSSSIFSPEWNEKVSHPILPSNIKASGDSMADRSIGLAVKPNRDSPKRPERERRSETPKKDRIRVEQPLQDPGKLMQQSDKRSSKKLPPDPTQPQNANPTNLSQQQFDSKNQALNLSGLKRPNDSLTRLDEDRKFKVCKTEPLSPPKMVDSRAYSFDQSTTIPDGRSAKIFSSTVNGIETDPDLVRNLLKESLRTENKLLDYVDIKPIEPIGDMETLPAQLLQNESPIKDIKTEAVLDVQGGNGAGNVGAMGSDQYSKSKSEKKKKKDKHKHKEKDKSKDKEERKKHKKDKERSKDRDRSSGNELEQNHVKLTIPKEKLNLQLLAPPTVAATSELKIKIPKDRIRAEFPIDDSTGNSGNPSAVLPPPSSFKIKISKDKIESYSHSQHSSTAYSGGGSVVGGGSSSSGYHSHSSKKKDRDRDKERDKDKKRSSSSSNSGNDHNKHNGTGSNNSGLASSDSSSSKTQSSSSSSNKAQQYSSNMSQLFGDLNDDDSSPSPPSPLIHSSHHYHQQQQLQHQQQQQQQQRYSHSDKYNPHYHQQQQQHLGSNYYNSKQ